MRAVARRDRLIKAVLLESCRREHLVRENDKGFSGSLFFNPGKRGVFVFAYAWGVTGADLILLRVAHEPLAGCDRSNGKCAPYGDKVFLFGFSRQKSV